MLTSSDRKHITTNKTVLSNPDTKPFVGLCCDREWTHAALVLYYNGSFTILDYIESKIRHIRGEEFWENKEVDIIKLEYIKHDEVEFYLERFNLINDCFSHIIDTKNYGYFVPPSVFIFSLAVDRTLYPTYTQGIPMLFTCTGYLTILLNSMLSCDEGTYLDMDTWTKLASTTEQYKLTKTKLENLNYTDPCLDSYIYRILPIELLCSAFIIPHKRKHSEVITKVNGYKMRKIQLGINPSPNLPSDIH